MQVTHSSANKNAAIKGKKGRDKTLLLKSVISSTTHKKGSNYKHSIILIENGEDISYECHHEQALRLHELRERLTVDWRASALIDKAKELFKKESNEGIFYAIIIDDINHIKSFGLDKLPKSFYDYIVNRNDQFLILLEDYLLKQNPGVFTAIHTPTFTNAPSPSLKDIFVKDYFELCKELFYELGVLDPLNQLKIKSDASALQGIIIAVKKYDSILLIRQDFSYPDLLKYFNEHLMILCNRNEIICNEVRTSKDEDKYVRSKRTLDEAVVHMMRNAEFAKDIKEKNKIKIINKQN